MRKRTGLLAAVLVLLLLAGGALAWQHFHDPLIGTWVATEKSADGATQTTTYTFFKDGLATTEVRTDKGSLLTIHAGGLFGGASDAGSNPSGSKDTNPLAAMFGAMFPTVRRAHVKSTFTVKGDVVTLHVSDVSMFDDHDQPVSLSNETHQDTQTLRYRVSGDTLTLDKLDGTRPVTLSRQHD